MNPMDKGTLIDDAITAPDTIAHALRELIYLRAQSEAEPDPDLADAPAEPGRGSDFVDPRIGNTIDPPFGPDPVAADPRVGRISEHEASASVTLSDHTADVTQLVAGGARDNLAVRTSDDMSAALSVVRGKPISPAMTSARAVGVVMDVFEEVVARRLAMRLQRQAQPTATREYLDLREDLRTALNHLSTMRKSLVDINRIALMASRHAPDVSGIDLRGTFSLIAHEASLAMNLGS